MQNSERTYLCIDLKSFYASVECIDRGIDPFKVNLVVADPDRSSNTICLAITPAMKACGVKNRCRLRDIPADVSYLTAIPRMRRYQEVSRCIYNIYKRFVAEEDMHEYSIDESFIDATAYLRLYHLDAKTFAKRLIAAVRTETGIAATVGIGPNLFLAKVALDISAKHASDGIGMLDQESFRRDIWFHQPITDIWGIGRGTASRLAAHGVFDLAGICALRPNTLRREFGKNAEVLLDHAWGFELCTIAQARSYTPQRHSIASGQVLMRDYSYDEACTVVREMIYASVVELHSAHLACDTVGLYIGYSHTSVVRRAQENFPDASGTASPCFSGEPFAAAGHEGCVVGKSASHGGGEHKLGCVSASERVITDAILALFDETVDPHMLVRRIGVSLLGLVPDIQQTRSLFDDAQAIEQEEKLACAMVAVRHKFGANALLRGTSLRTEANARLRNNQIGGHRAG